MGAYKHYGYARCHILNCRTDDLWIKTSEAHGLLKAVREEHLKVAMSIGVDNKESVCEHWLNYLIDKRKLYS